MTSGKVNVPFTFQINGKNLPTSSLSTLAQPASVSFANSFVYSLTYGTGSGQVDTIIALPFQLAASASNSHNFFDASIPDIFNTSIALQNIKMLAVYLVANPDGTTAATSATLGNAASNQLAMNLGSTTQTYQIFSGGPAFVAGKPAGYTVDATHKLFKVSNDDATNKLSYWLIAAGVHV